MAERVWTAEDFLAIAICQGRYMGAGAPNPERLATSSLCLYSHHDAPLESAALTELVRGTRDQRVAGALYAIDTWLAETQPLAS